MARLNNKMKPSPKAKNIKVAFWKSNTVGQDLKAGGEAIKRSKEGGHTNKSTDEFLKQLKESGEW